METKSPVSKQKEPNTSCWSFTMNSEETLVLMSGDHQPKESDVKTGPQSDGHISQIPGLSPTINSGSENRAQGKRVAVQESDSDYVKLAKQGGHKRLLWHDEEVTSKPNSYKPPSGFFPESADTIKPSKKQKNPGAFQPSEPPFWTDKMSAWERDNGSDGKEKTTDEDQSQMEKLETHSQFEAIMYKRKTLDKKPLPVDMSKLLSFGYIEDTKPGQ